MSFSFLNVKPQNKYDDALRALNGLISNGTTISKTIEKGPDYKFQHIPKTKDFCERASVKLTEFGKLKVVHVAGTKGKGSTCTYIEAILRDRGFKTGLFTSPHLVEVRERIKINGLFISKSDFSLYFWNIYEKLYNSKKSEDDMPFYFQFLTIMAFHVFLEEKVDVVILETGIGGRFDSTNILPTVDVACITSLGFDHMEILGNTIREIAWNKAGIIKPGSYVVTCDSQPKEGLDVILSEIQNHQNKLFMVPIKNKTYSLFVKSGIHIHQENALLASTVCQILLHNNCKTYKSNINISEQHLECLLNDEDLKVISATPVTGRYQNITVKNIDYFIDGAHTVESMMTCVEWFKNVSWNKSYNYRFLVFMVTGQRSVENLLSKLTHFCFDKILLCPLVPFRCNEILDFALDEGIVAKEKRKLAEIAATWTRLNLLASSAYEESSEFFNSFEEVHDWLMKVQGDGQVQVLVVGSLHLVGCALAVLDHLKSN